MRFVLRGGAGKWGKPTRDAGAAVFQGVTRTEKKEGKGEGEGVALEN